MNILPHKSWHVRTKKNIARVRKDEAKAAEEEKETQRRVALAAQESRTAFLRERANQRIIENGEELPVGMPLADVADIIQKDGHVNFFQEIEDGRKQEKFNLEHEAEKKQEQEDYEKKIGYLVYLGQNSGESSKDRPWYANIDRNKVTDLEKEKQKFKSVEGMQQTTRDSRDVSETQKSEMTAEELKVVKFKDFHDPLKSIRKYLCTPGVKKKLEVSSEKHSLKRKADESNTECSRTKKAKKVKKQKRKKHKHKSSSKRHKKQKSESKHSLKTSSDDETNTDTDDEQERKKKALQILREERLERERAERKRAESHLAKLRGETLPDETSKSSATDSIIRNSSIKQRYNSQFNPHLARQNFDN